MFSFLEKIILLLCFFFASQVCFAQHPLVWQVENKQLSFWVFGLNHFVPESEATPPKLMFEIYEKAITIAPESHMDARMYSWPRLSETDQRQSSAIFDQLVADKIISLDWAKKLRSAPPYALYEYLPVVLAALQKPSTRRLVEGYDAYFTRKAYYERVKKLDQLENRSHRKLVWTNECGDTKSYLRQVRALDYQLRNPNKAIQDKEAHSKATLTGDIGGLSKLYEKYLSVDMWKMENECSVVPRNRDWVETIIEEPQRFNKSMMLVGDAHVIGKDNFIELLERQGFKATLIKASK